MTGSTTQGSGVETQPGPHVAMIIANDVSTDTRVRKMAHDLAVAGLRVTVLGISTTGTREEMWLGPAKVVRLPVNDLLRIEAGGRFSRRNRFQLSRAIHVEEARYFNQQREVGARIGWMGSDYFKARAERNRLADQRQLLRESRQAERGLGPSSRWQRGLARRALERRKRRQARREDRREQELHRSQRLLEMRLKSSYARFLRRQNRLRARLMEATRSKSRADWRKALPELHDFEAAFGPELDKLRPDLIHAQDVHLLGVAARAASRGIVAGCATRLIYDSHEYIQGLATNPRTLSGWSSLEREYIHRADRVITVAPAIAEMLARDYELDVAPEVVMNIPVVGTAAAVSVRQAAGVADDDTLLVYSGGLDATRGVHTLVSALGRIEDVHLVLVSKATTGYTLELEKTAVNGGYAHRLHIVPFVEPQQVVNFLATADVAVHTIVSGPINHELTLPNKVFEYMHARLPIVISDCKAMSEFVAGLGIGEVFRSEDAASLAETISRVLENIDQYRSAYDRQPEMLERFSWRTERRKLFGVYRDLLGVENLPEDIETLDLAPLVRLGA